jgi:hypothetical protein
MRVCSVNVFPFAVQYRVIRNSLYTCKNTYISDGELTVTKVTNAG